MSKTPTLAQQIDILDDLRTHAALWLELLADNQPSNFPKTIKNAYSASLALLQDALLMSHSSVEEKLSAAIQARGAFPALEYALNERIKTSEAIDASYWSHEAGVVRRLDATTKLLDARKDDILSDLQTHSSVWLSLLEEEQAALPDPEASDSIFCRAARALRDGVGVVAETRAEVAEAVLAAEPAFAALKDAMSRKIENSDEDDAAYWRHETTALERLQRTAHEVVNTDTYIIEVASLCDFDEMDSDDLDENGICSVDGAYRIRLIGDLANDDNPFERALDVFHTKVPISCLEDFEISVRRANSQDVGVGWLRADIGPYHEVPTLDYTEIEPGR